MTNNDLNDQTRTLAQAMSEWFVRSNNGYFSVENPSQRRSKSDVEQTSLQRFRKHFPDIELSNELVRDVFNLAIDAKTTDPTTSIPVWDGKILCDPGNTSKQVPQDGEVSINCWVEPEYRRAGCQVLDDTTLETLLGAMFREDLDVSKFLDWLAWSLQNESDKPNWAIVLYSRSKGTGKSTLARLVAKLFGDENSITANNVAKLTGQFNHPLLQRKLVIAEEIQVTPESNQGNALKTFITEREVASERKGKDVETVRISCCFLVTTNHFPGWIEAGERRFWVIDCDHDGHASGPKTKEFGLLIKEVNAAMENPIALQAIYHNLMMRQVSPDFDPYSLDLSRPETQIMQRVVGNSREVVLQLLEEHLDAKGINAISLGDLTDLCGEHFKIKPNRIRHLMNDLGWHSTSAKWGGVDYQRSIWLRSGYQLFGGELIGPEGNLGKFHDTVGDEPLPGDFAIEFDIGAELDDEILF